MKRSSLLVCITALCLFALTACDSTSATANSFSLIYGIITAISLILCIGCRISFKPAKPWLSLLFVSVFVVNLGYFLLSVSTSLTMALWANRLAYLGSVFLPFSMMMIVLDVTKLKIHKCVPYILAAISLFIFLIAASPGVLDIYYKEVSLRITNGVAVLEKVYGPWHGIYLYYLCGYFASLLALIVYALIKKISISRAYCFILLGATAVNIGVWLVEQLVDVSFEFLSVSYIVTELFLWGLNVIIRDQEILLATINPPEKAPSFAAQELTDIHRHFILHLSSLTPKEREIYDLYLLGKSTREVMSELSISENTLRYHNKNIYSKLGVSSRKQLLEIASQIKIAQWA